MQSLNKVIINNDMATTTNTFSGEKNEDVRTWLTEIEFSKAVLGSTDNETKTLIFLKLRGGARSWAAQTIKAPDTISLEGLKELLLTRFGNAQQTSKSLSDFLTSEAPRSREEFTQLLVQATEIYRNQYMNIIPLCQVIINKAPTEIKSLLLQAAEAVQTWDDFVKRAENVVWIAFPNKFLNQIQEITAKKIHEPQFCYWHMCETHKTTECHFLNNLRKKQQTRPNQSQKYQINKRPNQAVRVVEENKFDLSNAEGGKDTRDQNKNYSIYSVSNFYNKNPFFIQLSHNNITTNCLIDTGADVSIIPLSLIKTFTDLEIYNSSVNVMSACGNPLEIKGIIRNFKLYDNKNKSIIFSPFVTQNGPQYIILGVDVIKKYPNLLISLIKPYNLITNQELNPNELKINLTTLITQKYTALFQNEIGRTTLCTQGIHKIQTGEAQPIYQKSFRIPYNYEAAIDAEIKKNLNLGIIRKSNSDWASRIVPVTKPDGTLRMCIDYRALNQVTVKDRYPIPKIDEIIDALSGSKIFTTLDATSGYYQIAISEEDKKKTAFLWKNGLYEFNRMPFGLCNAPATFQRTIDKILENERGKFVLPYLDDIIIYSKTPEEHEKHVEIILEKLMNAGIVLNKSKCKFGKTELKILGSIISGNLVKPDPEKVKAIREMKEPETIKELRSFLGTVNYCREYVEKYSAIMKPLYSILKGEQKNSVKKIVMNPEALASFKRIKLEISKNLEKVMPDLSRPMILTTDASEIGISAILSQKQENGKESIISAFSKNLDKAQENYSATDKELLAIVKGIENYRHYLLGAEFTLRTDHRALAYLWSTKNTSSRILRWSLKLQEYIFKVEYIKGEKNIADYNSRSMPINETIKKISTVTINNKEDLMKKYHYAAGHGSANTMIFLMRRFHNWDNMFKDIKEYVKKCNICSQSGGERINTKNRVIVAQNPLEIWEIDLIGRIPTKKGNKFIIVAIDHFTKWIETRIINKKTERNIIKFLDEMIIKKHGNPKEILSDSGLEFKNKSIQEWASNNNLEWKYAAPAHHKSVGCIERANQTLWTKIKKLCEFGKYEWEQVVEKATFATNISFNRAIRTSPYIMLKRETPKLDNSIDIPTIKLSDKEIEAMMKLKNEKFDAYKKEIEKGQRRIEQNFEIGEPVLIYKKPNANKLKANWHTGYIVLRKVSRDSYLVAKGRKQLTVNKQHLKTNYNRLGEGMS